MPLQGRKIVLAASDSESSEYMRSTWRQRLLATLPTRYAGYMGVDWSSANRVPDDVPLPEHGCRPQLPVLEA